MCFSDSLCWEWRAQRQGKNLFSAPFFLVLLNQDDVEKCQAECQAAAAAHSGASSSFLCRYFLFFWNCFCLSFFTM